jgi:outer membrane lipoprotein
MNLVNVIYPAIAFVGVMMVTACSSHIQPEIKQPMEGSPGVAQVRGHVDDYRSQKVRWGGVIVNTENKDNSSQLLIVAFPLDDDGEPQVSDQSTGRFIAIVDEFLEPMVYSSERMITVVGTVLRAETLDVGEFPYEYPVVQVEHSYLWPVREDLDYRDYPPYWWYDPWYPYYPYYYPYYPRAKGR